MARPHANRLAGESLTVKAKASALGFKPSTKHQKPRATAAQRGYGGKWRKLRAIVLAEEPLCAHCLLASSNEVDHIIPHLGDDYLMWERKNLQGLCKPCHSRKTATEDGGFGHERKQHPRTRE